MTRNVYIGQDLYYIIMRKKINKRLSSQGNKILSAMFRDMLKQKNTIQVDEIKNITFEVVKAYSIF